MTPLLCRYINMTDENKLKPKICIIGGSGFYNMQECHCLMLAHPIILDLDFKMQINTPENFSFVVILSHKWFKRIYWLYTYSKSTWYMA